MGYLRGTGLRIGCLPTRVHNSIAASEYSNLTNNDQYKARVYKINLSMLETTYEHQLQRFFGF